MRSHYGDTAEDNITGCALSGCGNTWLYGHWSTGNVVSCLYCPGEFCSQEHHDNHQPCPEHPGPCKDPECLSEDDMEPLDGTGWRCSNCGTVAGPESTEPASTSDVGDLSGGPEASQPGPAKTARGGGHVSSDSSENGVDGGAPAPSGEET